MPRWVNKLSPVSASESSGTLKMLLTFAYARPGMANPDLRSFPTIILPCRVAESTRRTESFDIF